MAAIELAVVDRHVEVERLIRTAELNHARGANGGRPLLDKPCLLYSSQVFGSGKTTFGSNAISLLSNPEVTNKLLNPPPISPPDTPKDLITMRRTQKFSNELVDSYLKARTVIVDMKNITKPFPGENDFLFQHALYHSIYCAAVAPIGRVLLFEKLKAQKKGVDDVSLMALIAEETGHTGKWFFFIDEIGYMEGMKNLFADLKNPAGYNYSTKAQHIDSYTCLFDLLYPFLVREDTFVFCAGKSASLTERSLEESGSPLRLQLLVLSPLQQEHIVEILQKTLLNGQSLQKALGVSDNLLPSFVDIVHHYTAGIPRLVCRTFESLLLRSGPIPHDKGEIVKVMNKQVRDDIITDLSSFFRPQKMSADAIDVYATLLLMSVLHVKIKKSSIVRIGPEGTKFVLDWVSNFCLYISPDGPDMYKLVFSQFLVDYLQKFPPNDERRIVLLASLLEQLSSLPGVIDQGRILEVMLAQPLAFHLAFADKFGDIPGLKNSMLCDVAVARNVGRGYNIRFLPSFQTATTEVMPHMEEGTVKSYCPSNWDLFFQDLLTNNYMNVVGITREKNSHGPDLVLPIQAATPTIPNTLPDLIYELGIATNDLQSTGATDWSDIADEIAKGLTTPLQNKALAGKLQAVLLVASTRLMKEIEEAIGAQLCIVCGAGTWYYNEQSRQLCKDKNVSGWQEKFTVPKGGELVILSKNGMTALLGDSTLDILATYFHTERERCENLLSMERALSTVVRKRKRDETDSATTTITTPTQGRTVKLSFVDATNTVISTGMADIPFGTTLVAAQVIIGIVLNKKAAGRVIASLTWEGVPIADDDDMECVKDRHEVVVLLK